MDLIKLLEKAQRHYEAKVPFVIFALPDSAKAEAYFKKTNLISVPENETGNQFIFAPFNPQKKKFHLVENQCDHMQITLDSISIETVSFKTVPSQSEKERHIELIEKSLDFIRTGAVSKVVVSRRKSFAIPKWDLKLIGQRLFHLYPNAFRYIWYHPETALWCGATPELLFTLSGAKFTTMSLAGTRKFDPNKAAHWEPKEREEQQIVTDNVVDQLSGLTTNLTISETYDHRAGSLVHLRTDVSGILEESKDPIGSLDRRLHPTPAVCGFPKVNAEAFILDTEGYDREFYTGYLGPINANEGVSQVFVNLRCMKLDTSGAYLYAGGGITGASNPESEWYETENKLHTMGQVIGPALSH